METLVWNTRLRMERDVGGKQVREWVCKWPDYKARFHSFGGRGGVVYRAGILGYGTHVTKRTWVMPRSFETKATLSVDIIRVEFNLNGLSNNAVHISGFRGEDGRIVELNAVSVVDTVFSYGQLVRMS
jgi:hypothetical protein